MTLKEKIGEQLRIMRIQKGLTQSDVCGLTELTQANYSRIEQGKQSMTLDQTERIFRMLGFELDLNVEPV